VLALLVRRTWLLALAATLACAAFAARAVASLVEASYLSPAADPAPLEPRPVAGPPPRAKLDGSALVARNMFCSTCTLDATPPGGPGPANTFVPPAVLVAIVVGGAPRATLIVPATGAQGSWGAGDRVSGVGTLVHVGWSSVELVDDDGRLGRLSLRGTEAAAQDDSGAATPGPAAAADPWAGRVERIDDQTFAVERGLVRELVSGSVAAGARVTPITRDGKLAGLRVLGVRDGSLARAVGLANGDVLEAINNQRIESANTLLELYARLEQLTTVELAGTRAGRPITLTLRLR
jgi:membrane-associated protease RseP (regulator of RpoE activity)